MIAAFIANAQIAASRTAQTAVLGLGAAICLFIGLGFFTLAGWIFLASVTTTLNAAVIIGGIYVGLGLIVFATISIRSRAHRRRRAMAMSAAAATTQTPTSQVIAAFLTGMTAGQKARF